MNDKLLQEVAHLLRKYYDDRGAKLEQYAEKVITLIQDNSAHQILSLDRHEFDVVMENEKDPAEVIHKWKLYKQYIADTIEEYVLENKKIIKIYEEG